MLSEGAIQRRWTVPDHTCVGRMVGAAWGKTYSSSRAERQADTVCSTSASPWTVET